MQDFSQFPAVLTPAADFFVRNHFSQPPGDQEQWSCSLSGLVATPRSLRIGDIPYNARTVRCVLECAGNGVGVGAVGCADWSGISLADLLRAAGVSDSAKFVRFTGADRGTEPDADALQLNYSRVLSIDDIMHGSGMLVTGMNGRTLPSEHGGPARVIIPGRYGMDSVKWLTRVELVSEPAADFFMTHRFRRVQNATPGRTVGRMLPKSVIVRPADGESLRGTAVAIGGYAWGGSNELAAVRVRLNGRQWMQAKPLEQPARYGWEPWSLNLGNVPAGAHRVEAQAMDNAGESQPEQRDPSRQDEYELNQIQQVRFFLRP